MLNTSPVNLLETKPGQFPQARIRNLPLQSNLDYVQPTRPGDITVTPEPAAPTEPTAGDIAAARRRDRFK